MALIQAILPIRLIIRGASAPRCCRISNNSTTSNRRSPFSYFATKDCGRPSLPASTVCVTRAIVLCLVQRIGVQTESIEITIRLHRLTDVADPDLNRTRLSRLKDDRSPTLTLSVAAKLQRAGLETKLLINGGGKPRRRDPDRAMLRLLAQAYRYREMVLNAQGRTMLELAKEAGVGRPYFSRVVRLGFMAPNAVKAILQGWQAETLTANDLSHRVKLPKAWNEQMAIIAPA